MARIKGCTLVLLSGILINQIVAHQSGHVHDQDFSDDDQANAYKSPVISGFAYLAESFDDPNKFISVWIKSETKKEGIDEDIAKYVDVWSIEPSARNAQDGDLGLVLTGNARHAAIAARLNKPFKFDDKPLVVQYEVNFQEEQECGGAYLKLLTQDPEHMDLKKFKDKTPYTIMFGPDKCGTDHKLHFIFRHKNPINGSIEEKHCKKPRERLEDYFKDKLPHLYTLIVRPDNTFQIKIDNKVVNDGSLLDDFTPPVNPSLEIEDPTDVRPEDWDEREKIPDPTAVKPDDWDEDAPVQIVDENNKMPSGWLEDESPTIPNPDAVKPDDWDVKIDGDWEPPQIPNPKCDDAPGCGPYKKKMKKNPRYKGKWYPPLIDNPNYKGKWKPRLIHNPDYFNDEHPFKMMPIHAIGFELWFVSGNIYFDNLIITDDEDVAKKWGDDTFEIHRQKIAQEGWSIWRKFVDFTSENPWIWAVYILVVGLPLILIVYCCCFTSKDKEERKEHQVSEMNNEELSEPPREDDGADGEGQDDAVDSTSETDKLVDSDKETHTNDGNEHHQSKPNNE